MLCIGFSFPLMAYQSASSYTDALTGDTYTNAARGVGIWGYYMTGTVNDQTCERYIQWSGEVSTACDDSSSSTSGSNDRNVCDSEYSADYGWLCTTQWLYTVSFALSCLGCCATIGGAFGPKHALAGAAGLNFCSGLFCMITASYVTASHKTAGIDGNPWSAVMDSAQKGAPYKANFSYAALWLGWLLGWKCAAICAYAFTQGDGEKKEEVVVVDHGRGETYVEERVVVEATVAV
jgi:hypothetical protein